MGLRDVVNALLGVSAYQRPTPSNALKIDSPTVERVREYQGGNLAPMPHTRLRWYLSDLDGVQTAADGGNLAPAAQLYRAMGRDGQIRGLLKTLTSGIVRLPKKFYGDPRIVEEMKAKNGSRSVFDDMFPPSELSLLAGDGHVLGVGVAELVPVPGRSFPVMLRIDPEYLQFRWSENRWYFLSVAGPIEITPGDGRWILHTPGGRVSPWQSGLWPALGRAYINKEHALLHRSNYGGKLANPARVAQAPSGATEKERTGFLAKVIAWGVNTVFELPPGWEVKLIESAGRGYEVFQADVDTSDREAAISIAGQMVTVDGGAGFQNSDIHRAIRADIIKDVADALAFTLNTQGLPCYVATHYGLDRIATGITLEWDVSRPNDLLAQGNSMNAAAGAIKSLGEALKPYGRRLDVSEITTRFEIPVEGDDDGDGLPDGSDKVDEDAEIVWPASTDDALGDGAVLN